MHLWNGGTTVWASPEFIKFRKWGRDLILQFVSRVLRESLRVTVPDITLYLVLVLRNHWKKSVGGMSSPRLQHTTGGGLNAFRASKPVLFTNKMQRWMNHRLSPTCWHTQPLKHMPEETHALTRQDWLVHTLRANLSSPSALCSIRCGPLRYLNKPASVLCLNTLADW